MKKFIGVLNDKIFRDPKEFQDAYRKIQNFEGFNMSQNFYDDIEELPENLRSIASAESKEIDLSETSPEESKAELYANEIHEIFFSLISATAVDGPIFSSIDSLAIVPYNYEGCEIQAFLNAEERSIVVKFINEDWSIEISGSPYDEKKVFFITDKGVSMSEAFEVLEKFCKEDAIDEVYKIIRKANEDI